ncbi:MAG: MFS transporter, partial [Solirubrobacterales bacterium]
MRRLLLLGSTVVFIDVAFYSAITPLLPDYVDELGLSKAAAGLLSAAYAAGTLIGSLPAGFLAARIGPRRTLLAGLLLLGLSSAAFGFANDVVLLDTARFVQGLAGALAWAGALSWLIMAAPEGRRGAVIGGVLGTAVAGELLGPALGALASEVGTEGVFSSVLLVTLALSAAIRRIPEPGLGGRQRLGGIWASMSSRPVLRATWYVAAPSALFGVVVVLVPLRIDELGGGAGLVAAGFAAGAALETVIAPLAGRVSDRAGRLRPYAAGMVICAVAIVFVPVGDALGVVIAALIAVAVGAGICFAPALTMLSDSAEATGLHQGFAAGLTNMAWAAGQVTGGVGGGALAGAAGDALPCLLASGWLLATAIAAWRAGERGGAAALVLRGRS